MLQVTNQGFVRSLKLDRPEALNAFNGKLFDALAQALFDAAEDDGVRVLILTGEGRAFCAGLDLLEFARPADPPVHGAEGLYKALLAFPKPLIIAVNGLAIGFGATIFGHADMVFMAEGARLRCPFTSLGLVPEAVSTYIFPLMTGRQQANWILLSSEWLDADACKEAGLVLDVFPDAELMPRVMERAQTLAALPLASLVETKELLKAPHREQVQAAIEAEDRSMGKLVGGPANKEALRAFREKRPADFSKI